MASPVAGLRPMRAARFRTCRMPRPPIRMRSPFLRCLTILPTRPASMASACFFESSLSSATLAARCFNVTVVAGLVAMRPSSMKRWRGKSARHIDALDDSAATDHACFADSTDVFALPRHRDAVHGAYHASQKGPFWGGILDLRAGGL